MLLQDMFLVVDNMGFIDWQCKQKAVYWPPKSTESGSDDDFDDYGQPIVSTSSAVEIDCMWIDRNEEIIALDGTAFTSRAVVHCSYDVELGGILMLGELTDIEDAVNIKENPNAWEIRAVHKIPELGARNYLIKAFL